MILSLVVIFALCPID
jgi:hypothetical protein